MARPTPRSVVTAVVVTAASLLLTGCFSVESSFTIHDDGTADVEFVTLIDTAQLEEFASLLGEELGPMGDMSGEALLDEMMGEDDPCGELTGDLGDYEVTTEEIDEDGSVGVRCVVTGVPLDELTSSMQDDESTFTITQDDDGTQFSATLAGVDELAGDADEMSQMTEMLDVSLDDIFSIVFSVTAPGSLGDNNATSTDGSTASWDVTPDAAFVTDGDAVMTAEWSGSSSSSSSSILWIILAVIGAAVIIGAIVFLVKRNKSDTPDTPGTPDAPADATVMTPPPPPGAATAPPSSFEPPPPPPPPAAPESSPPPPPPG